MKLPLFHTSSKFETLFKEMDTKYSVNEINVWEAIEDSIVSEILRTGEVLIENEELGEYIEDDDFFRVNNRTVLVYIKNQYLKYWSGEEGETRYRYHLYNCITIRKSIEKGRKARYVFRDPVFIRGKGDDIFEINSICSLQRVSCSLRFLLLRAKVFFAFINFSIIEFQASLLYLL